MTDFHKYQIMRRLLLWIALSIGCFPAAAQSVDTEITVGDSDSRSLARNEWLIYRLNNPLNVVSTTAMLSDLSGDIDLYIQYDQPPAFNSYACRSWASGTSDESCDIDFSASSTVYIGVNGYRSGNYTLSIDEGVPRTVDGTTIGQRSGRIEWNGWKLDYDTFALNDGLALQNVSFDGTPILSRASFPIMSVYYRNNVCGPYADRLNGPQAIVDWADNTLLVAREYTQNGEQWFELGIREFIGSYDIYQVWYFSADGTLDGHVFSRGLQCKHDHIHYPMWRFDFDIDGEGDDHVLRQTAPGAYSRYTKEFETRATSAYQHGWFVEDAISGYRVRVDFDDGAWSQPGDVVPASTYAYNRIGAMSYRESEEGWTGGASPFFPYDNGENLDGADVVLWYRGYLPHLSEEGGALWHSSGVSIKTNVPGSVNTAPIVDAGPDQSLSIAASASLAGTVLDDGQPTPPGEVAVNWLTLSGPGQVSFEDSSSAATTARFSVPGSYVIQLTANDGQLVGDDTLQITVRPEPLSNTIEVGITSRNDDAEETASGGVKLGSFDLELGEESTAQIVGMRFDDVDVPPGATITAASVQFTVDESSTGSASLSIHGQASSDASTFNFNRRNLSVRQRTAATVDWSPSAWLTVGASGNAQRTPDISAIVQEIVDQAGWREGNAMVLLIEGSGRRTAESYNGDASSAPVLRVEFQ